MKTYLWAERTTTADQDESGAVEEFAKPRAFFLCELSAQNETPQLEIEELNRERVEELAKRRGTWIQSVVSDYIQYSLGCESKVKFLSVSLPDDLSWNSWLINQRGSAVDWEAASNIRTKPELGFQPAAVSHLHHHVETVVEYVTALAKTVGAERPGSGEIDN